MIRRLVSVAAIAIAAVAVTSAPARAQDVIVTGAVVKLEHHEIYVSLGDAQGVTGGATIRIKRTIKLRHPVSGAPIEDWIPIGSATVTQAGTKLSRAVVGELVTAIRVGDVVEVLVERRDPGRPGAAAPPPRPPSDPEPAPERARVDPATAEVLAAFGAQTGAALDARIAAWERYLSTHAGSPFGDGIRRDLDALHALREQLRPDRTSAQREAVDPVDHAQPRAADPGAAFPVVFVLQRPDQVASAYLHYRTRDKRTFQRTLLVRDHEIYLHGTVPAEAVRSPGVDYFVEVSTPAGRSGLALGSPSEPLHVEVKPPPLAAQFGSEPGHTSVRLGGEYLDLATFDKRAGDHRDRIYSATIDFAYRFDAVVQRVGVGYGVIAGVGGWKDTVWDDPADPIAAPRAGFHDGHARVELGWRTLAVTGELIAGVGKTGFGLGGAGIGRIGAPDATNLAFTARTVPELGWVTDLRFGAQPARDLLIGVAVGATDQPNRGDVAARLTSELEWIGLANVSVLVRASWQGRAIQHGGIGGGAAVGVSW